MHMIGVQQNTPAQQIGVQVETLQDYQDQAEAFHLHATELKVIAGCACILQQLAVQPPTLL
jgi:hypothetical protein